MNHTAQRLLSASFFQALSSASRHQLRIRRPSPRYSPSSSRIWTTHRPFTSSRRLRQENDDKSRSESDSTKLAEEPTANAKVADETPTASDIVDARAEIGEAVESDANQQQIDVDELSQENSAMVDEFITDEVDVDADGQDGTLTQAEGISEQFELSDANGPDKPAAAQSDLNVATILGYGDSEAHRDLREYARLAAWELPLLHKLKQPFQPPTSSTPLRFRYTSYMGEEHPAAKKVVVEFKPAELPGLNQQQQINLIKLVGPRYNPAKQEVKMSCESFETPAQNKRYLADLVQKLVQEAKNMKDQFADVPVDLRHHKQKPVYKFPEEWKITPPARLVQGKGMRGKGKVRRETLERLEEQGNLVDGEKIIRETARDLPLQRIASQSGEKTVLGSGSGRAPVRGRARASPRTG